MAGEGPYFEELREIAESDDDEKTLRAVCKLFDELEQLMKPQRKVS